MSDFVNGLFEWFGAFFIVRSIARLGREKRVAGVTTAHPFFFLLWGLWNLWFYPALGCMFSFVGGLALVLAQAIWFMQILGYRSRR